MYILNSHIQEHVQDQIYFGHFFVEIWFRLNVSTYYEIYSNPMISNKCRDSSMDNFHIF